MVDRGEVIAFSQVRLGDASTVLMYETRILTDNDGYVLMADGTPYRVDKAKFDTLTKPKN
jgi:outer membrane usher protein FimD/PapC